MKKLLYLLIIIPILTQAQIPKKVIISPSKLVTVQLPVHHRIVKIRPGLEDQAYTPSKQSDNLFVILATGPEFPPSNLTVFCDSAIFFIDIEYSRNISQYSYKLSEENSIKIEASASTEKAVQTSSSTPVTDHLSEETNSANLTPADTLFYVTDRLSHGKAFNSGKLLAYVSNLYGNDELITLSLRITNKSSVTFHSDAIDTFIITKVKKKSISTIGDDDPIPYRPLNTFPATVRPNTSELFILQYKKFSLDQNNRIKLVIGEGQGRRTIAFQIASKTFYNLIKYY